MTYIKLAQGTNYKCFNSDTVQDRSDKVSRFRTDANRKIRHTLHAASTRETAPEKYPENWRNGSVVRLARRSFLALVLSGCSQLLVSPVLGYLVLSSGSKAHTHTLKSLKKKTF